MTLESEHLTLEGVQYATGEDWRETTKSSANNEVTRPKWKWHTVVNVDGDKSEVQS